MDRVIIQSTFVVLWIVLVALVAGVAIAARNDATTPIDLTCILWLDASGETGWQSPTDYNPYAPIFSCGQLVQDTEHYVILAMDLDILGEQVNQVGSIPKGMVQWRQDLVVHLPTEAE